MDFKSLISKISSLDDAVETPKAPEAAQPIRLDEDTELRVLAGVTALTESVIAEKAVSKAQQKFMGMVHAAQKGEKAASPEVAKVAKDMGKKDAKDFAATKHKGLPEKKTDESVEEATGFRATGKKKGEVEKSTRRQYFVKLEKGGSTKGMTIVADEGETESELMDRVKRDARSGGYTVVGMRLKGEVGESFYDKFDALVEAKKKDDKKEDKKEKKVDEAKKEKMSKKEKKVDEGAKPDFLDLDKDGNKKEPMKAAAKDKGGDNKDKDNSSKGLSDKQKKLPPGLQKAIAKKTESKMMPKGKKRPVKESVEQKLSFRDMMKLVVESGGQQQIDPLDKELFSWAERVAKTKLGEGMKAEVYAGLVYERMGGRFEMFDVLSEEQK